MKHPNLSLAVLLVASVWLQGTALRAQQFAVVPPIAAVYDSNAYTGYPLHYGQCRVQQVIAGAALGPTGAVITDFAFRREADGTIGSYAMPTVTQSNTSMSFGHTSVSPTTMSSTFASNVTGAMTQVVSGVYQLPAQPVVPGPAPFNVRFPLRQPFVYTRAVGDLLFDTTMNEPAQNYKGYWVDAYQRRSYARYFVNGVGGLLSSGRRPRLDFVSPFDGYPGGSISLELSGPVAPRNAVLFLGLPTPSWRGIPLPFDLAAIGAPGNTLNVAPFGALPVAVTLQANNRYLGRRTLGVPNDPRLAGHNVYFQAYLADSAANALGLVFSSVARIELGGGDVFTQTVISTRPDATTGSRDPNAPGGPVLEFGGAFY